MHTSPIIRYGKNFKVHGVGTVHSLHYITNLQEHGHVYARAACDHLIEACIRITLEA